MCERTSFAGPGMGATTALLLSSWTLNCFLSEMAYIAF